MMRIARLSVLVFVVGAASLSQAVAAEPDPAKISFNGFHWPNHTPGECPWEQSEEIAGIYFNGRCTDYYCGDTFYPTWADDGNLYSPFTDGATDSAFTKCASSRRVKRIRCRRRWKKADFFAGNQASAANVIVSSSHQDYSSQGLTDQQGLEIKFKPKTVKWVKFEIMGSSARSLNIGLSEIAVFE